MPDILAKSAEDAIDNLQRRNAAGYPVCQQTVASELSRYLKWRALEINMFPEQQIAEALEYIQNHI